MVDYDYSCMIYSSRNGFRTKSNRIEFDCIRFGSIGSIGLINWTQRKMDVRLGLIEFCFNFVQLDTPALLNGGSTV